MDKELQKDCRDLIVEIFKNRSLDLEPTDLLLWIYLNMYFYHKNTIKKEYSHEVFMELLGNSKYFIPLIHVMKSYEGLGGEVFQLLKRRILEIYTYRQEINAATRVVAIDLKDMEMIYEGLLLEGTRSRTGAYYTPLPIVNYMVVNSLLTYVQNQLGHLPVGLEELILGGEGELEIEKDVALEVNEILKKIKIIDLACGGGVFLREAMRVVFRLKCKINAMIGNDIKKEEFLKETLEHLYGIDLQPNTVLLCRLLLLMEYENLGGLKEEAIELNVLCKNALTMEEDIEKKLGSFDIVLGNPPYIGERGNRGIFDEVKNTPFGQKYYEGKMDYFYFFIHRGGEILKKGGVLGFITTNYFVTADGASKLRSFLRENFSFKELVNFNEAKVFKDAAGQHSLIFIAIKEAFTLDGSRIITFEEKKLSGDEVIKKLLKKEAIEGVRVAPLKRQENLYDAKGQILLQSSHDGAEILNNITKAFKYTLGDFCQVNQGIVSGADRLTGPWSEKLQLQEDKGKGIFVLTEAEVKGKGFDQVPYSRYLKDFYKNSDVKKYRLLNNQGLKILYLEDDDPAEIEELPALYQHLVKYTPLLRNRREVMQGRRKWYALQWPRNREIFEGEKIVVPQRSLENAFAYHKGPWYASADVYYITLKDPLVSLKTILAILNSALIYFWLLHRGKRKGEYLELYGTPLKAIPFPTIIELTGVTKLEDLVEEIEHSIKKDKDIQHLLTEIDEIVYNLYHLKEEEKELIRKFVKERRD